MSILLPRPDLLADSLLRNERFSAGVTCVSPLRLHLQNSCRHSQPSASREARRQHSTELEHFTFQSNVQSTYSLTETESRGVFSCFLFQLLKLWHRQLYANSTFRKFRSSLSAWLSRWLKIAQWKPVSRGSCLLVR